MVKLEELTPEEIESLGLEIGKLSEERPDVVHRFTLGLSRGLQQAKSHESLGSLLWSLWRHGNHDFEKPLPIPFGTIKESSSGTGLNK